MQITSKGRHAVRIMADLARHKEDYVPLTDVAARQEITIKYLEKIVSMLSKAGLVVSMRGASGGYKLCKPANEYTILEILEAVGEGTRLANCTVNKDCARKESCDTMKVWIKLSNLIDDYLKTITLEDLIKN